MPGVVVSTAVRSGPTGVGDIQSGQMFLVGETERGPSDKALLVRSFAEYVEYYGNYAAGNLWIHAKTYFEEGGSRLYIGRDVATGGTAGTLDLTDGAAIGITLTAASVGAWSANLKAAVLDSDSDPGAGFRIRITLGDEVILTSPDFNSADYADIDATHAAAADYLNTRTDLKYLLVATADTAATTILTTPGTDTVFSTGAIGTVTATTTIAAANALFTEDLGAGAIAAPGNNGTTTWDGLRDHAYANNRIAICAHASTATAGDAKSDIQAYYGDSKSNRMAFYFPQISVTDPVNAGLTVAISPEAYVGAVRAKATQGAGAPFRAAAGVISNASSYIKGTVVNGVDTVISKSAGDLLDNARVNAIRTIRGDVRIYGARSASNDEANWRFITWADMLNHVTVEAERRLEQFVFATIDSRGNLFGRVRASMVGLLDPLRVSGGLYEAYGPDGTRLDAGYSVLIDSTNNPPAQLANGIVKVDVGIRVSSVGDQISITITKSNLTASVA